MSNEKDMALALQTVREIDVAFENSERLRLGRWVAPDERERTLASFIAKTLATIRQEERRAVWSNVFNVVSAEGSFGARQLIKSLEGAREQDGCGPTK